MKIYSAILGVALLAFLATQQNGCNDADVASRNLSVAADNFQINRRIIFYNGMSDSYMMIIEGKCSLGNDDRERRLSVTCKTGEREYKKHFLGLSDNVTFFVEQIDGAKVSTYHYKVVFKPQTIIPDFDLKVDSKSLKEIIQ